MFRMLKIRNRVWCKLLRTFRLCYTVLGNSDWRRLCIRWLVLLLGKLPDLEDWPPRNYKPPRIFSRPLHSCILQCCSRLCMHHLWQLAWNGQCLFCSFFLCQNYKNETYHLTVRIYSRQFECAAVITYPSAFLTSWKFLMVFMSVSEFSSNQKPGTQPAINASSSSPWIAKFCPAIQNKRVLRHLSCSILHCIVLYWAKFANSSSQTFKSANNLVSFLYKFIREIQIDNMKEQVANNKWQSDISDDLIVKKYDLQLFASFALSICDARSIWENKFNFRQMYHSGHAWGWCVSRCFSHCLLVSQFIVCIQKDFLQFRCHFNKFGIVWTALVPHLHFKFKFKINNSFLSICLCIFAQTL